MSRKFLIIFLLLLGISLGLISRVTGKPRLNSALLLSPWAKYAKWIDAQSKHETDSFTSRSYRENNNLFGMKNAVFGRADTQLGKARPQDEYRVYSGKGESIRDLVQWFRFTKFPQNITTLQGYVQALKDRDFFEDSYSNYLNGLKRFL